MKEKLKGRAPLLAAVGGAVMILILLVGLIFPAAAHVRTRLEQVGVAKQQQSQLRLQLEQLQADAKASKKTKAQLKRLETEVPATADLPGIIRLLNTTAGRAAIDFMAITPGQPLVSADGLHSTVPATITVSGDYFALDEFLFKMEGLPRVSKVIGFQLSQGQKPGALALQLAAEFYTTDASAGPGSSPGATVGTPVVQPAASPADPSASPSTGPSSS
jgi:Tfp pilus assembly protein PilO